MAAQIQHFLLVFDHGAGRLKDLREFGVDAASAVAAYSSLERQYQGQSMIDIVLIGSDSLETVKITHANYFDGTAAVSHFLAGI